jgi:hypothetical protein
MSGSLSLETPATTEGKRRVSGIAGLCGALLFFTGDMLSYGHLGSGAGFHQGMIATVRDSSLARLYAGGLLVAFVLLMVSGSAIHTLWTTRGLALKYCYGDDNTGCRAVMQATNQYWDIAYYFGAVPAYFGFILLVGLVVFGKTWYPRWTVLVNPAVLLLLVSPLADKAPAPFGSILSGGFTNLSIALFFAVSIWTTWQPLADRGSSRI